ncbi:MULTISPECIES: hypothetical protein [Lactobacillus]|uniref:Uncharacterized protein n=1 Tax=Lactobacillus xujianguonis TaxID=2495899 RepID=A0A437SWL6_9LACO|nr:MULTISPECIES: hypothetical protein [Lactobacillus]RVU71313.1 hypothetical protein EJK17_02390 [Lactobacillus xujianguonis]RVU74016.1 hypothetical protein EJK20_04980 [Lactobacillus xujianguonis]
MKLPDFLQMISNLNPETTFFIKNKDQILPLAKITLTANECLFLPGKKAMTQQKIIALLKKIHHRHLSIYLLIDQQQYPIYGLHLTLEKGQATVM